MVIVDGHERKACFFDLIRIAAGCSGVLGDFLPGGREFGDRRAAAYETIGPGAGALKGDLCATAGEDRNRFLDRPWAKREVLDIEEPAFVRDVLLGPEAFH